MREQPGAQDVAREMLAIGVPQRKRRYNLWLAIYDPRPWIIFVSRFALPAQLPLKSCRRRGAIRFTR